MANSHAYWFDKRKLPYHVKLARARVHRELTSLIDDVMGSETKRKTEELASAVEKEIKAGVRGGR